MRRILIAEDEGNAREALIAFFQGQGFDVRASADGEQAIEIAREFEPDVLVSDWLLQGECSGVGVARAVAGAMPYVVIVLISGYPIAELRAITGDINVVAYMPKPISLFELKSIINGVLPSCAGGNSLPVQ
jgi:DNA-binding response OmpR family regulator